MARFADTKDGVLMYGDDRVRPYAYTYRDYVIRAMNEDLPFDQFVHDQVAADQLAPPEQKWRLAAMGFLTLGRQFDNNIHDQIDDQIDTLSRGFLGLTASCARCHDHKYDPVPTSDYYSLYGVLAGSQAPLELPLIAEAGDSPAAKEYADKAAPLNAKFRDTLNQQYELLSNEARNRTPDYLVHAATQPVDPLETAIFFLSLAPTDLRPQIVHRWRRLVESQARPGDPVWGPWQALMAAGDTGVAEAFRLGLPRWRGMAEGATNGTLNPIIRRALLKSEPRSRAEVARLYGEAILAVFKSSPEGAPADPAARQIWDLVGSARSPAYFRKSDTYYYLSRSDKDAFGGLRNQIDRLAVASPGAPPRAMVLVDSPEPYEPRIFVRGNPSRPGDAVPRRFLAVASGPRRVEFRTGSGRAELAQAITSPSNPLTARVIVNRVWMHHFGEPLVSSPSDFGRRATPPTHPELLDWLATAFRSTQSGPDGRALAWSLKGLHRLMVLSHTYQQASTDRPAARQVDPENRLLWRANRRRLDFEQMRDTLLSVAGQLDPKQFGRPEKDAADPNNRRRTVYTLVDRQSLPELYRVFDFAVPDQSVERRPRTTVPQQALFAMNSPFVAAQARAVAAQPELTAAGSPEVRIQALYRRILQRQPNATELQRAAEFLKSGSETPAPGKLSRMEQLAQVLLLTNEVMFLD